MAGTAPFPGDTAFPGFGTNVILDETGIGFGFNLETTAGDDFLRTGVSDDTIFGSQGSDLLDGGEHSGGQDNDTLSYENLATGVHMSVLMGGTGSTPMAYRIADIVGGATPLWQDQVQNFETYILTGESDFLSLNPLLPDVAGLTFDGGANEGTQEFLIANYIGNTVTTILADEDILSLESLAPGSSALVVDLGVVNTTSTPADGTLYYESNSTLTMTINNFEGILGSDGVDKFFGTNERNVLFGFDGNDTLVGRGGEDLLVGDAGDDVLYGGFWWSTPGTPPPDVYADDGATDILYGGVGNDTYYVSNQDLIFDMIVEQSAVAISDGQGGLTLRSMTSSAPAPVAQPAPLGKTETQSLAQVG